MGMSPDKRACVAWKYALGQLHDYGICDFFFCRQLEWEGKAQTSYRDWPHATLEAGT